MGTYLSFFDLSPRDEMRIASSYLRDIALQKYISHPDRHFMEWSGLKKLLLQIYKPIDTKDVLKKKLTSLKQTNGLEAFIQEFDKILSQLETRSEEECQSLFIYGLKPEIGNQVITHHPILFIENCIFLL